jgi:hypothetical protein
MPRTTRRPFILPYEPEYAVHRGPARQWRTVRTLVEPYMTAVHRSPPIAPEASPGGACARDDGDGKALGPPLRSS